MSSRDEQLIHLHHNATSDNEFINYISNRFTESELELLYDINSSYWKNLIEIYLSYNQHLRLIGEDDLEDTIQKVKYLLYQTESDNESFQTNSYDGYPSDSE